MLPLGQLALVALLAGLLTLDRTAFLQSMASRPLVGSTLAGLLLGDGALGLRCGLLLELLWLMDLPVGASVPPDESLAGVVAAALAAAAPPAWGMGARAAAGVLLALPVGCLGRRLDVAVRRANGRLLTLARERLDAGARSPLSGPHLRGGVRFFAAGVGAAAVGAGVGSWALGAAAPSLPQGAVAALELAGGALPLLGAGAVLAALPGARSQALFAGAVGLGSLFRGNPVRWFG